MTRRFLPGKDNPNYRGGSYVTVHGYRRILVGKNHPLADTKGYAYEHTLVWVSARGKIKGDKVLHHINHDKLDNRLENLELVDRKEHTQQHIALTYQTQAARSQRREQNKEHKRRSKLDLIPYDESFP